MGKNQEMENDREKQILALANLFPNHLSYLKWHGLECISVHAIHKHSHVSHTRNILICLHQGCINLTPPGGGGNRIKLILGKNQVGRWEGEGKRDEGKREEGKVKGRRKKGKGMEEEQKKKGRQGKGKKWEVGEASQVSGNFI